MIERVISGGQTGADQAGWRAAKAAGIATGGWMPKGFKTESGYHPEFAELYGAKETTDPGYPRRTRMNAGWGDATVFFGNQSSGYGATRWACTELLRPFYWHDTTVRKESDLILWIAQHGVRTLNIAGNRESSFPGIGVWVEAYLAEVFAILKT